MRHRGLLQVSGDRGGPVIQPYFTANGKPLDFHNPSWELIAYWIPTAHLTIAGLDATLTWCAPPDSRAAFLRMTLTNHKSEPVGVTLGVKANFGAIDRVTYVPVALRGERTVGVAPWVEPAEVFSYITNDTDFAWTLLHPGSKAGITTPPTTPTPAVDANQQRTWRPEKPSSPFSSSPLESKNSAPSTMRAPCVSRSTAMAPNASSTRPPHGSLPAPARQAKLISIS